jgi:serine/threonine-protein kinase
VADAFVARLLREGIGDRYAIDRELGSGGMGVVVAGRRIADGERVAVKVLRPEHAKNGVTTARFLREAALAARVKSAHVVRVVDVGRLGPGDTGEPYFAMEMLAGRDLREELDVRGRLPVSESVDYLLQACEGVGAIHALGVVHRDLKPANLFLDETSGARVVKVLDFGISKQNPMEMSTLTAPEQLLGTPQYMSPEQIRSSKTAGEQSDVWSLGVILYELLTGVCPFEAKGAVAELFGQIMFVDPAPATTHRPDLPPALAHVVAHMLRRPLDERIANVAELARALRPFAGARAHVHR